MVRSSLYMYGKDLAVTPLCNFKHLLLNCGWIIKFFKWFMRVYAGSEYARKLWIKVLFKIIHINSVDRYINYCYCFVRCIERSMNQLILGSLSPVRALNAAKFWSIKTWIHAQLAWKASLRQCILVHYNIGIWTNIVIWWILSLFEKSSSKLCLI